MDSKDESVKKPEWNTDDATFKVIKTGTLSHDHLTIEASTRGPQFRQSTVLYDALALSYNQLALGDLLMVDLPNRPSTSNLRKVFEKRGLNESDCRIFRPTFDEQGQRYPKHKRPLVLQRCTDQKMRTIQPFQTLAEHMAKEATQRGTP
ncbi:hypothetical protein ACFPU0_17945 [Pseudomonas sp. GCM10022186]|uniref:hypothetical protein n=1 Tax=Pseudomonas sp. GCM10022186 TaxID=3252650 RepID=UPI0036221ED3